MLEIGQWHKRNQERDLGGPWTPQKVPNLSLEGPKFDIKLYLRHNNGFKKEENAWVCLHNASLEGQELFGPPKILAQNCLWLKHRNKFAYLVFIIFDFFYSKLRRRQRVWFGEVLKTVLWKKYVPLSSMPNPSSYSFIFLLK